MGKINLKDVYIADIRLVDTIKEVASIFEKSSYTSSQVKKNVLVGKNDYNKFEVLKGGFDKGFKIFPPGEYPYTKVGDLVITDRISIFEILTKYMDIERVAETFPNFYATKKNVIKLYETIKAKLEEEAKTKEELKA